MEINKFALIGIIGLILIIEVATILWIVSYWNKTTSSLTVSQLFLKSLILNYTLNSPNIFIVQALGYAKGNPLPTYEFYAQGNLFKCQLINESDYGTATVATLKKYNLNITNNGIIIRNITISEQTIYSNKNITGFYLNLSFYDTNLYARFLCKVVRWWN